MNAILALILLAGPACPPPEKAPNHNDVLPGPYWIDSRTRQPEPRR